MGIFGRIFDLVFPDSPPRNSSNPAPKQWYGVPPPDEDDLIHKYCTGQVDCDGNPIVKKAASISISKEEEVALLDKYYHSSEEKADEPSREVCLGELGSQSSPCTVDTTTVSVNGSDRAYMLGSAFEQQVHQQLDGLCAVYGGEVFSNIVVPRSDGQSSELDLVAVLPSQIIIIECKAWHGTIYAGYDQSVNWSVYLGHKRYSNYSPVKQNCSHARALSAYLGTAPAYISSAIVFLDSSVLKELPATNDHLFIGHLSELGSFVGQWGLRVTYEVPYLELSKSKLRMLQCRSEYKGQQHRSEMEHRRDAGLCPVCGHQLVKRVPRSGGSPFYGCSMYPQCKYIKRI